MCAVQHVPTQDDPTQGAYAVPEKKPSTSRQVLLFASNFLKHPRMLGSLIPSSRFLVDKVLGQVDWQRADVLVEYGPGVGNITAAILRRMRPDATLVVIETNVEFVEFLRDSLRDPRLHVVHGSAADVTAALRERGLERADYVVSGIPFTTLLPEVREAVLRETRAVLRPGGAFLVYQFTRSVLPDLRRVFGRVQRAFVPLNILPAHLFYCTP
jgi:phospholipid N-methyltransferase